MPDGARHEDPPVSSRETMDMKAVGYRESRPITDAEALLDLELPDPTPGPRDLCVAVQAISVNPVDVKMRPHSVRSFCVFATVALASKSACRIGTRTPCEVRSWCKRSALLSRWLLWS